MQTSTYKVYTEREATKIAKRNQARVDFMEMLDSVGGAATVEEVAALLGSTPTSVVGQVNSGRLIGIVDGPHQSYVIPMFQFDVSSKLKHLEEILAALGDVSAVAACTWFLNPLYDQASDSKKFLPYTMLKAGVTEDELRTLIRDASLYGTPMPS
jgi:hypothetical protein